jgi:predicted helicase
MAKLTQKDTRSNWRGQQQTSDRKSKGIDIAGNNVSENLIILQAVFYEYSIRVPAETLVFDSRSSLLDSGFSGLSFSWDERIGLPTDSPGGFL